MNMRVLAAVTVLAAVFLPPSIVASQRSPVEIKPHMARTQRGIDSLRDKPKPVRSALEAQYAKMAAAYRDHAPEVILDLRTPDFEAHAPNGERWDAERSAEYTRAGFQQVERTLDLTFAIRELDVRGDTASAWIPQQWSRVQWKGGQLRRVETSACQRETWVHTPEGWRLRLINGVQPLVWKVDGKRVDPRVPFDAEAPPFVPDEEIVSRCTAEP